MSAQLKRGITIWILSFLAFLAGLNAFNAVIMWTLNGIDTMVQPYLIGDLIGPIKVTTYFWTSITTTFIFLGLTSIIAFRKLPPDPTILETFAKIEENLATNRRTLEDNLIANRSALESTRMDLLELFTKFNKNLDNARKEILDTMQKQEETAQKIREELLSAIETKISDTRQQIIGALQKQVEITQKVERSNKKLATTIKKQIAELTDVRTRLEKMEKELTPPKPRLTSLSKPEEIKGIGPVLGEELRAMGITTIGELITADPATIDEKTRASREIAERLQATAQLLMVPGVDENDAELLKEAGITSRRELADQDPIQLSKKMGEVAKTYIEQGKISESEKPIIEEVLSWIRMAKS